MQLDSVYSYLVHPGKGVDTQPSISSTKVTGENRLVHMLGQIYDSAPMECTQGIYFRPNADGEQQNDCRDLVVGFIDRPTKASGLKLANRLQTVTTNRSGLGLLFLMHGADGHKKRLVVSRFPADHGILADERGDSELNVEFVERVFMKSAAAYKSVYYEGSAHSHFWRGHAIDKQVNREGDVANYWIRDFLLSEFSTSGKLGTMRFAVSLRDAIRQADDIEIKQELSSLARLLPNLDGQVKSASEIVRQYGLSGSAAALVRRSIGNDELFNEQFKFTSVEFSQHVAYRSVELDNGALMTAETEHFDDVFAQQNTGSRTRFTTVGTVVDDRLRKSKS